MTQLQEMSAEQQKVYQLIENHYRKNRRTLLRTARRMVGRLGEDALQEAYCRACKYWKSYDFNRDFDNWIYGLLKNATRQLMNEERRHGIVYKEEENFEGLLLPSKIGNPEKTRQLKELFLKIQEEPEDRSYILRLSLVDGYTSKEVAQIVPDFNENAINNIVYRFRKENRKEFR